MTKQAKHTDTATLNSQRVWLEGVINARELGGYMNREGKKIKGGKILRTGQLYSATSQDMKALSSPSIFHGALSDSFDGDRPHILWRIDSLCGELYIILLSEIKPDLASFCEQFSDSGNYETKNYDELLSRITVGSRWRFRITANPTKSVCKNKGERGKVAAHITAEYQKMWLAEKSIKNGFVLNADTFDTVQCKWKRFYKKDNKYVTLLSVTYEGVLEVTDTELFKNALISGIGRGKAYGMGLMTIMRVQ